MCEFLKLTLAYAFLEQPPYSETVLRCAVPCSKCELWVWCSCVCGVSGWVMGVVEWLVVCVGVCAGVWVCVSVNGCLCLVVSGCVCAGVRVRVCGCLVVSVPVSVCVFVIAPPLPLPSTIHANLSTSAHNQRNLPHPSHLAIRHTTPLYAPLRACAIMSIQSDLSTKRVSRSLWLLTNVRQVRVTVVASKISARHGGEARCNNEPLRNKAVRPL